jgi:alkylation response protein AidB-like acyl-CoA dehydrogenase
MELRYPPEAEAFRQHVQGFLAENLPPDWAGFGSLDRDEANLWIRQWRKLLADNGLIGLTIPVGYGGGGRSKVEQIVLAEEFAKAGVPTGVNADVTSVKMMGNTLVKWGTEEQKARFLPGIISGDEVWVQGYSEPNAGSDLAGMALSARRDGDEWVLNGQKIWTSRAQEAHWIFLLARTNPEVSKHRGISFVLCRLDAPGVEVRPIRTLNDTAEFCEVFFDDVRTPVAHTIGEVDNGWAVANSLLGLERGEEAATNPILFRAELDRLVDLARERGKLTDPVVRDRLAWCYTKVEVMRMLGYRILTQFLQAGEVGPASSIAKLYWSEYHQVAVDLALQIYGADAMVGEGRHPYRQMRTDDSGAPNSTNAWLDLFLFNARSGTVYAGTSQVQRNILGERVLGLPKEPA